MKTLVLSIVIGVVALAGLLGGETRVTPLQPFISNITVENETVLLTVEVPTNFIRTVLQTRSSLQGSWEDSSEAGVPKGGGVVQFRFPRRNQMLFARVSAFDSQGRNESMPVNYIPISPKNEGREGDSSVSKTDAKFIASLHFKAIIDGLDTIRIEPNGILWTHLRYQSPHQVSFNGQSWNPAELNFVDLGAEFAKNEISWEHSEITVISGRDIVALEKQREGATVHIYDTPWGASEYEFNVKLFSAPKKTANNSTRRLLIRADIDGSDELLLNAKEARWTHKHWQWPLNVEINGLEWNPKETPILETSSLAGVDFRSARLVSKTGRGFANVEARKNDILVSFADDEGGAATYELEIVFDD